MEYSHLFVTIVNVHSAILIKIVSVFII